jgi:Flp pilus assembly protein TadG
MKLRVSLPKDCQGSVTVMTMILMFLFVGILALVIDLAHLQTVKTELSNAADDCALRGAGVFCQITSPA